MPRRSSGHSATGIRDDVESDRSSARRNLPRIGRAESIDLLDNMKDPGFRESSRSGLSFATDDLKTPASKDAILAEAEEEVARTARLHRRGIIADNELEAR